MSEIYYSGTRRRVARAQPVELVVQVERMNELRIREKGRSVARLAERPPVQDKEICCKTFSDGCLGSHNDEERSEMRYVLRLAESRESSKL